MRRLSDNMKPAAKPMRRLGSFMFRVALLVWYAASSIGLPAALHALRDDSSGSVEIARNDGCRCSIKKKLSGTCCCSLRKEAARTPIETPEAVAADHVQPKSCCAKPNAAKTHAKVSKSCCSNKALAKTDAAGSLSGQQTPRDGAEVARSISRCGCSSTGDLELNSLSMLALPVGDSEPVICATVVEPIVPQSESWPSLRHEPPEPPPRA